MNSISAHFAYICNLTPHIYIYLFAILTLYLICNFKLILMCKYIYYIDFNLSNNVIEKYLDNFINNMIENYKT